MEDVRRQYCTTMTGVKAAVIRPWMLSFRADFGLAGYFEKETLEELVQLIFSEGFMSDPDEGSFEKLSCASVCKEFLESPYKEMNHFLVGSPLLRPFSLAYVKGWKRSVALLTGLCGIMENQLEEHVGHSLRAARPVLVQLSVVTMFHLL